MQQLLDDANQIEVPKFYYTDAMLAGTDKIAQDIRDKVKVEKITNNPAMHRLFIGSKLCRTQLSFQRAFKYSTCMMITFTFLATVIVIGGLAMAGVFGQTDVDSCHTMDRCYLEDAWFYIATFIGFILLFIQPGWISLLIFSVFIQPIYVRALSPCWFLS